MLRNDQYFGPGNFGQLSCFMPERAFVIFKELSELKNGGWKRKQEFAQYLEAPKGIPETSDTSCATIEFFDKLPIKFFEDNEHNIGKHVLECWRFNELIPYP